MATVLAISGCSSSGSDTAGPTAETTLSAPAAASDATAPQDTAKAAVSDTSEVRPAETSTVPNESAKNAFTYAIPEPRAIDPARVGDLYGAEIAVQAFDGLTDIGPDLSVIPAVASAWKASSDGLTWTFTLRDDSRFANGRKVVASDFVYAFARAADPDLASTVAYQGLPIAGWGDVMGGKASGSIGDTPISGVKATGDTTLSITTTQPFALLPKVLSHPVFSPVPKELLGSDKAEKTFAEKPVGNGPFTINGWAHNEKITLARSSTYAGTPAKSGIIEAKIYSSYETSYRDAQAGNIGASDVPLALLGQARTQFGAEGLISTPQPLVTYIGFRTATKPFDNADLRRAFSLAIDRDALVAASNGGSVALKTFASPTSPLVTSVCGNLTFDPVKAKELYSSSGGLPGGAVDFTYASGGTDEASAKAIANDLHNNLGINVKLKPMEFAPFVTALRANSISGIFGLGWSWDYPSAYNFLSPLYESTSSDNNVQYKSAPFDALMEKIRTAPDEAAGAQSINEALDRLCTDMPGSPTTGGTRNIVIQKGVSGLAINGLGFMTLSTVAVSK